MFWTWVGLSTNICTWHAMSFSGWAQTNARDWILRKEPNQLRVLTGQGILTKWVLEKNQHFLQQFVDCQAVKPWKHTDLCPSLPVVALVRNHLLYLGPPPQQPACASAHLLNSLLWRSMEHVLEKWKNRTSATHNVFIMFYVHFSTPFPGAAAVLILGPSTKEWGTLQTMQSLKPGTSCIDLHQCIKLLLSAKLGSNSQISTVSPAWRPPSPCVI